MDKPLVTEDVSSEVVGPHRIRVCRDPLLAVRLRADDKPDPDAPTDQARRVTG